MRPIIEYAKKFLAPWHNTLGTAGELKRRQKRGTRKSVDCAKSEAGDLKWLSFKDGSFVH